MSKSLPSYSLEEILSVIARSILSPNVYYDEDYELLRNVEDKYYFFEEEV